MIQKKHELPPQILKAAENNELIIFVGAGASKLCGSPDWRGFADKTVAQLEKAGMLNFIEAEQLKYLPDPRRTLSVAMNMAKKNGLQLDYNSILHPDEPLERGARLYEILAEFNSIIVTTNYDKWAHKTKKEPLMGIGEGNTSHLDSPAIPYGKAKYFKREHFTSDLLTEKGAVIHLHGSYNDSDSMVISLRDYIRHYADEKVKRFLAHMFTHCTVLFLGYGLGELEILDHIVRSNDPEGENSELAPKHFILYPMRSTDSKQSQFTKSYFHDECRVTLIEYEIDQNGWGELVDVLESWAPEIKAKKPSHLDYQHQLNFFFSEEFDSLNRASAINLVAKQPDLKNFFLNSINNSVWFNELEENKFFAPDAMPELIVTEERDGSKIFEAPHWPALRYLEIIAPKASDDEASRILKIIRSITAHGKNSNYDNWRVWATCATIISLLPLKVIELADINMAEIWLRTQFNADIIGHNLSVALLPRLLESSEIEDANKALALVEKITVEKS